MEFRIFGRVGIAGKVGIELDELKEGWGEGKLALSMWDLASSNALSSAENFELGNSASGRVLNIGGGGSDGGGGLG